MALRVKVHSSDTGNMTLLHQVADGGCRAFCRLEGPRPANSTAQSTCLLNVVSGPCFYMASKATRPRLRRRTWHAWHGLARPLVTSQISGTRTMLPATIRSPHSAGHGAGLRNLCHREACDLRSIGAGRGLLFVHRRGDVGQVHRDDASGRKRHRRRFWPFCTVRADLSRLIKKHFVAASDLPAGHVLEAKDMDMKRVPDVTGDAVALEMLTGRALLRDVPIEHRLTRTDVACRVWALPVARSASSRLPGRLCWM